MKKYNQRRSSKVIKLYKQQLHDLEHKLQVNVGELLVSLQEGTTSKAESFSDQARSNLLKFGPDMQKIANEIGGNFPKRVSEFLSSIDHILLSGHLASSSNPQLWIDNAKIHSCHVATQRLEDILLK